MTKATSEEKPKRTLRDQLKSLGSMALVVGAVFTARASLADHYYVPSGSMLPTINIGDRIIVDKTAFGLRIPLTESYLVPGKGPARGDVVVLASPEDGTVLLKRIAGLPGDHIEVREGQIVVDGKRMAIEQQGARWVEYLGDRIHELDLSSGGGRDLTSTVIPKDMYLVLGDNRGSSRDGRFFGFVSRGAILGRAIRLYRHSGEWTWLPM